MNITEALPKRFSCRAFDAREVEAEKLDLLRSEVERANAESGLHLQLFGPGEGRLDLSKKMFAGEAPCYLAFVGEDTPAGKELVGYFGERVVLTATALGLGTCWVAGTFDRKTVVAEVGEGEVLHDVIPFGYAPAKQPLKQRTIRAGIRSRDRKPSSYLEGVASYDEAPAWIRAGIDAVIAGPSAVNGQPVTFTWDGTTLTATLRTHKLKLEETDLGIAKLHFELAAAAAGQPGSWQWGDGAAYVTA